MGASGKVSLRSAYRVRSTYIVECISRVSIIRFGQVSAIQVSRSLGLPSRDLQPLLPAKR